MNLSHFCIDRPIFASVISIVITLGGAVAMFNLPIAQQVNGADNMIYMNSSSSSTGNLTVNAYFQIGTNPELAQVDVQNRVNLALPQLPSSESGVPKMLDWFAPGMRFNASST